MPELMRSIAAYLRDFFGNRRHAPRRTTRLDFKLSLVDAKKGTDAGRQELAPNGYTRDISATGLALIVPAIRIGDYYLSGEDHTLRIWLKLQGGLIQIDAIAKRHERLDDTNSGETGYLIGAHITEINEIDRALFTKYYKSLH